MVLFWRFCNLQCRGFAYVHRFRRRRFGKAGNRDHAAIHFGNQRQRNHAGRLMREQVIFRQRCGMVVGGLDDCAFRYGTDGFGSRSPEKRNFRAKARLTS